MLRANSFEFDVPMPISIKKAGENTEGRYGDQVKFATSGGTLYLDPQPASAIEIEMRRLGIRYGEVFSLTRAQTGGFIVRRTSGGDTGGNNNGRATGAAQTPPPVTAPAYNNNNGNGTPASPAPTPETPVVTPASAKLMACLKAAIDAAVEAEAYATRQGLELRFSSEDIRTMANTIAMNGGAR